EVELRLEQATTPAYEELEANRLAVLERNRGQLS
ncbi:MAG: hypothetical protein JWL64_950, partial [Frankiales bacterium]|nr:hypothetical protein [Frankiales bacterium]